MPMNMNLAKNTTRISSILGTWTVKSHLKSDIGKNELLAYSTLYFMPDAMRGYGCSLENCREDMNNICMFEDSSQDAVCKNMADSVVDWSDVALFIYFGAAIDVGFPMYKHSDQNTGDWVGPFNMIMAKDASSLSPSLKSQSGQLELLDRYHVRYVQTPMTSFLRKPVDCNLLGDDDFNTVLGSIALEETVKAQYDSNASSGVDPYEKYHGTCDNGSVMPILPLITFDFMKDSVTGNEVIKTMFSYKLPITPKKNDVMYTFMPEIQRRFNKKDSGFHLSGPYCFDDDPHGAYTFDMNYDSQNPKKMIQMHHGCVDGLPCTPPAAAFYTKEQNDYNPADLIPDEPTTVKVGTIIYLIVALCLIGIVLLISFVFNFKYYKHNQKLRKELLVRDEQDEDSNADIRRKPDELQLSMCEETFNNSVESNSDSLLQNLLDKSDSDNDMKNK